MVILYFLAIRFKWCAIVCKSSSDVAIKIWSSALQYKPKGRRNIGRPRKRWRDQLHLEDQGTGNTPNASGTWWWWWWYIYNGVDQSVSKADTCACYALAAYKYVYRVSQEECARLRESVPYVKVYRYNPKHLCSELNGYGDNGQRSLKLWQLLHTYWLPNTY